MESRSKSVLGEPHDKKLSVEELAEALYEGTPHLQNLAEKLVRQHSNVGALPFYHMTSKGMQKFWVTIAQKLINYSKAQSKGD